jgi:hypothetical protein
MPTIPLTKGFAATVDEEDFEALSQYGWFAQKCGGERHYAARKDRSGHKEKIVYLHHAVIGKFQGMVVDHINGDPLDNRRENLRVCSYSQNAVNSSYGRKPGVFVCKQTGRFGARTAVEGKRVFLGRFDSFSEAADAVSKYRAGTPAGTGHAD